MLRTHRDDLAARAAKRSFWKNGPGDIPE